jgi:hypothetical protein
MPRAWALRDWAFFSHDATPGGKSIQWDIFEAFLLHLLNGQDEFVLQTFLEAHNLVKVMGFGGFQLLDEPEDRQVEFGTLLEVGDAQFVEETLNDGLIGPFLVEVLRHGQIILPKNLQEVLDIKASS